MAIIVFLWQSASIYAQPAWLAYGDLRGNIQPCGCDPQTDLGGVRRIGSLLKREKTNKSARILVFDLGNNFHQPFGEAVQSRFLSKALDQLAPEGSLLLAADLPYWCAYQPNRSFVLSNHSAQPVYCQGKLQVREAISSVDSLVLGYSWHEGERDKTPWGLELKKRWMSLLKGRGSKTPFLLFDGPVEHLQSIVAAGLFAVIISTSRQTAEKTFDQGERDDSSRLLPLGAENPVYQVPVGGAGVLRGGALQIQEVASVEQLVAARKSEFPGGIGGSTPPSLGLASKVPQLVSWLTTTYDEGSPLADLLTSYEQEEARVFKDRAEERLSQVKNSKFVGAEACKGCHAKAYAVWKTSKHAVAYHTLEQAFKGENPSCVSCHVLGFTAKGGFVSVKETPQFAGVQCENCHGPRKEHSTDPRKYKGEKGQAFSACGGCHNSVHSPKFEQDKFWPIIRH